MTTPEQVRLAAHADSACSPAIASYRRALVGGKAAEDDFFNWLSLPWTQRLVRALEEFADNPALCGDQTDVAVQYGFTSGLQTAVKLVSQPQRLFPEIFRDPAKADDEPLRSFTQNADAVIDNM